MVNTNTIKTSDIKRIALTKGMNLRQLAIKAGIPYNTLFVAIQRNSKINADNMAKIINALDHPFDEFDKNNKRFDNKVLSGNESAIVDIYRSIIVEAKKKNIKEEIMFEVVSNCLLYNKKTLIELAKENNKCID